MTTYITTQQAARELNVSSQTIRNWVDWKILRAVYVKKNPNSERAGRIYIDQDSIKEAIENGKI